MRMLFIICLLSGFIFYLSGDTTRISDMFTDAPTAQAQALNPSDNHDDTVKTEVSLEMVLQDLTATAEPPDPADGSFVLWMSNGEGIGDKGNIMLKISSAGKVKAVTVLDFDSVDRVPVPYNELSYLENIL